MSDRRGSDRGGARLFGLACGTDYPTELVAGMEMRFGAGDPATWARGTLFVNSGRMRRRIRETFDSGPPRLLPRIRLISDLAEDAGFPDIPPSLSPLELKLDLAELILSLIERTPGLAPRAAAFDLAESLAALIEEMHGEGVGPEDLAGLDVGDFADHWQRGRAIVEAAFAYLDRGERRLAGAEARRRRVVEALLARWSGAPPQDPVIIAGSTGSRGATAMLMEAVARLPNGYVVLPGYDFDQPAATWAALDGATAAEDHPQYRFRALMTRLDLGPGEVERWTSSPPPSPERNRLVSLALRPAPVTDQWRAEGRSLQRLDRATAGMSLLEAPSQRVEATSIALRLRRAVEDGQSAALITPDRALTRRVTADLQRWGIEPDDSAGEPLHQTAAGRFLRHVAELLATPPHLPALLSLLKHPLAASSPQQRGPHLRWTHELEIHLRRRAVALPSGPDLVAWARGSGSDDGRLAWAAWLAGLLDAISRNAVLGIGDHVARHLALAERLAAGPDAAGSGALWDRTPGETAREAMAALRDAAGHGGALAGQDYLNLLRNHLQGYSVQDPTRPHPGVMIWGTLEARIQGAELTILAGLNDGIWPDLPGPDTWLNRRMRRDAGLLLPDRRIGLAAHDFQQAIAARDVLLTRSLRDEEAETIPSRWLNRLTNLLGGLGETGQACLEEMRQRGRTWQEMALALDRPAVPVTPATRPSPSPPVVARPKQLSVTQIATLIRDPYAIYARHILRLRPLDPLLPLPDARLRGIVLHRIMEEFLIRRDDWSGDPSAARIRLSEIARDTLQEATPLPAIRAFWHARLMQVADRLVAGEIDRLAQGAPVLTERAGGIDLPGLDFRLSARPDRIDLLHDGSYAIYDYKSGTPPTAKMVRHFEKQLPLEAAMLERGGFSGLSAGAVSRLGYISIGASDKDGSLDLEGADGRLPDLTWEQLHQLVARYRRRSQGYTAMRAAQTTNFQGDYDHLARYGEWDLTEVAETTNVGSEDVQP